VKILVACEESGVVTQAFRELGHEAWSCDIEPTSGSHPEWHLQQDVTPLLSEPWDMIIAFPPCTHLAVSGARHFEQKRKDGRQQQGIDFFMMFANSDCPRVAIENPVGIMSKMWRKPDQIIQPWQFGHPHSKATCLWLKGLPKLEPTNILAKPATGWTNCDRNNQNRRVDESGKVVAWNDSRMAKLRSKTYLGIAQAMAAQWSRGAKMGQLNCKREG
jgi:hypothetical protein